MRRPSTLPLLALAGCNAPSFENFTSYQDPTTGVMSTSSAGELPTTSGDGIMTTTAALGSSSTGEAETSTGTGADSSSTGAPVPPPLLGPPTLTPNPLLLPGPIAVSVSAEAATGVRMQVDDKEPVELTEVAPGSFEGEIWMYSALVNGGHEATFIAWQGEVESVPEVAPFVVMLPTAGSELFWDSAGLIGKGSVAALVVLPSGELVEFGTHYPMGSPRCYLRRRDQGGKWLPGDLVTLSPSTACVAIDMEVDAEGALHLLASRTEAGQTRWWLGELPTWGAEPANVGQGPVGETASALAIHPKMLAVCAARPQPTLDVDAVAAIFRPNAPGEIKVLDYVPPMTFEKHRFGETPRDCVFVGETLTLVGEASGRHDDEFEPVRDRLFVLEMAPAADPVWTVAVKTMGMQSGGASVAVDVEGRLVIGGFICEDACYQSGSMWIHTPGVGFTWPLSLGSEIGAISAMAASPAGYVVIGSGKKKVKPWEAAFWVQAWIPGEYMPKWTYLHDDAPALQIVHALAIGPYGQVYAGGVGAGGFPAVAYVGG